MDKKENFIKLITVGTIIAAFVIISIIVSTNTSEQKGTEHESGFQVISGNERFTEETISKEEDQQLVREAIDRAVADWYSGSITYDEASAILAEIQTTGDSELSTYAGTQLAYITLENNGNLSLLLAQEHLENTRYLEVFKTLNSIDTTYSRYAEVSTLYASCSGRVLNAVSAPDTKEEFETYIELLEDCYSLYPKDDFLNRKEELVEELAVFLDVTETIDLATARFDAQAIEESFILLALGLEKYPDNEMLATTLIDYRDHYIITITKQAIDLCEKEEYKEALSLVENAIEEYDCDEFQMLLEGVKEEKSFLYRLKNDVVDAFKSFSEGFREETFDVKQAANDAGAYIVKSGEKLVLGDYSEENITLLSFSGNIVASLLNADIAFDLRDLSYSITHWGEGEYFAVWLAVDVIALIPVIGVVKYLSHFKTVSKGIDAGTELVDSVGDIRRNAENTADLVDSLKDITKTGNTIIEAVDSAKDAIRASEAAEDVVTNIVKGYTLTETINQKLLGKFHEKTGVKFKLSNVKLSDGRKIKGVFPVFDSFTDVELPEDLYKATSDKQKEFCLEQLQKKIKYPWSSLRKKFTAEQLDDIADGIQPEGLTWHHNEREGLMQLVDTLTHDQTAHTGGMSLWGCGY